MAIFRLLQRATHPLVSLALSSATLLGVSTQCLAAAAPQITQKVSNQQRVTLHGSMRAMPLHAQDLGRVDANLPAGRVMLLLKRPAAQETALAQFLSDVHTRGTASYHKWLTPTQFGSEYGPADTDVLAVVTWLQSQGFAVAKVSKGKTTIEFSGTAGQIESAFATQLHSFRVNGETHVSNVKEPQIPAALAPVIAGISHLNDFRLKPLHTAPVANRATAAPTNANPHAMTVERQGTQANADQSVAPTYTAPNNGGYYVTPADVATIYDTPNATLNRNHTGSLNLVGTGVTIGIAGASNVAAAGTPSPDVANYRALFGLPALAPTVVVDGNDPGVQGDNAVEALLDLEVASGVAPGANLNLYVAQDTSFQQGLFLAIQRALDDNAVNILNVSFGGCEAGQTLAVNEEILNFWQQAAAQGISVTVSSGDSGSAGCDDSSTETAATVGLQVNGLASTPFNIAVGGTDFNQTSATIPQYWSATNSAINGSALGAIPEIPWNDSTTTIGSLAGNVAYKDSSGNTNINGAGGGVSGCLDATFDSNGNLSGCTDSYAKPSWQSAFGSGTARELPDVSLFAGNGASDAAWLVCASGLGGDTATETDCVKDANGNFNFQGVGGTSAASPAFAGMLALVIQQLQAGGATGVRLGQADYTLYPLSQQVPAVFRDVTTGNNSVPCVASSLNCGANDFLTGYDAGTGYDLASGLGSVDATQMVQNWSALTFKPTTTALQLNGSTAALSLTHGTAVTVAASVTASGGTPTGSVVLTNNSTTGNSAVSAVQGSTGSPSVFTLSNGAAGGSYAYLPGGSYTVAANYGGDGTFGSSTSNGISVNVAAEPSTLNLVVQDFLSSNNTGQSANNMSLPYGTYVSVAAEPIATSQVGVTNAILAPATGSVTFTGTAPLQAVVPIDSNGIAEIPGQLNLAYAPGAYTVSASYPGDPSFTASTAAQQSFTITKASTVSEAGADSTGTSLTVEVDPSLPTMFLTSPGTVLPTGTVTVTSNTGTALGTGTLAPVTFSDGSTAAQATVAVNTSTLGTNALTLSYPGDGNYNGDTGAFSLQAFAVTSTPTTVNVTSAATGSSVLVVTPQGGFTGTVNLSCKVTGGTSLQPSCALAAPSLTFAAGSSSATDAITFGTTSSAALEMPSAPSSRTWYAAGGVALGGMLLFGLPRRRRAWQSMLSLLLLVVALGVVGCGGSSSNNNNGGGVTTTPAGTYTATITATSGSTTQTTAITVTVQ